MPHHRAAWSGATSPARRVHGTPPGDADGNTTGTRAAEDVGPYHTPVPATAHSAVRVSTLPRTTTPRAASATSTLGSTFRPGAHR